MQRVAVTMATRTEAVGLGRGGGGGVPLPDWALWHAFAYSSSCQVLLRSYLYSEIHSQGFLAFP